MFRFRIKRDPRSPSQCVSFGSLYYGPSWSLHGQHQPMLRSSMRRTCVCFVRIKASNCRIDHAFPLVRCIMGLRGRRVYLHTNPCPDPQCHGVSNRQLLQQRQLSPRLFMHLRLGRQLVWPIVQPNRPPMRSRTMQWPRRLCCHESDTMPLWSRPLRWLQGVFVVHQGLQSHV
jgi:hypothetical protein